MLHGLQRAKLVNKVKVKSQGRQQFTLYVYSKVRKSHITGEVGRLFNAIPKTELESIECLTRFEGADSRLNDNVLNNYIGLVQAALDKLREVSSNQLPRVRVMNTFAAENVSVR